MTMPPPPAGQGPVDPRGAFSAPPPVGLMPPPFFYPPPPPPRGSFARGIFMTLATSIFGLSIALNVYLLLVSGIISGTGPQQTVLVEGDSSQKVAVVDVTGVIMGKMPERFDKLLSGLEKDSTIKALVVRVDTPGGTVPAADEIYNRMIRFKENRKIPIIVSMGGYATSGGYYVSCAADKIVAETTTWTGNVGVYLENLNFSRLADKWGIEDTTIRAAGSDFKTAGSPLRPMTPEEQAYLAGLVNDAYAIFKDVIKAGRGTRLTAPMETVANGKVYTAADSLKMGLIDQIGYARDAYALAASTAGITNAEVIHYEATTSLLEALFGSESRFNSAPAGNVTVNGVNMNIDRHWLDQWTTPKLMALWRGE
ncbi:MAG TPA: signal peptide peptidase SppA [Tepidisphaeraceae bacterium]|nr:signal peptide peptidase SppA [Tepidisphaeraceae bacterium]